MNDFLKNWKNTPQYFDTLQFFASLSGLFADGVVPYLHYRLAENVFCNSFGAINDARACNAYDAHMNDFGIGIKTFIINNNASTEKIAEFNRLKPELDLCSGKALALKLAEFRNERIMFADNSMGIQDRIYHIIGRQERRLRLFNSPYVFIDKDHIKIKKEDEKSLSFTDGKNDYLFNRSKSVLMMRFEVPSTGFHDIDVDIIDQPLEILKNMIRLYHVGNVKLPKSEITVSAVANPATLTKGRDYVILPLFSSKGSIHVPEKSGLNQWNAAGRNRDPNEVYIPIPSYIYRFYPDFFPERDEHFTLVLPDGNELSAKVCQEFDKLPEHSKWGKALMSTHNADLGQWILRKVLNKKEGELVTMKDLDKFGIDSVMIVNKHCKDSNGRKVYTISFTTEEYERYADFVDGD